MTPLKIMLDSRGNRCALITDAHSPCLYHAAGERAVQWSKCVYNAVGPAGSLLIQLADITVYPAERPDGVSLVEWARESAD